MSAHHFFSFLLIFNKYQGSDSSNSSPSSVSSSGIASTANSHSSESSSLGLRSDSKCRLNSINDNQIVSNNNNNKNRHHPNHHNHLHPYRSETETNSIASLSETAATGKLALDRLLASLAIESDKMEQQLAQINGNGNMEISPDRITLNHRQKDAIFTYPSARDSNFNSISTANAYHSHQNGCHSNKNGVHSNLNDVIANLTEFTRHETMRQLSLINGNGNGHTMPAIANNQSNNYHQHNNHNNNHNNHVNGGRNYQESNAIKRLTSESENSSSISPSLSERSNGVSWSDQV